MLFEKKNKIADKTVRKPPQNALCMERKLKSQTNNLSGLPGLMLNSGFVKKSRKIQLCKFGKM